MGQGLICNGVPWFDQNLDTVNAHGACVLQEGGKFYLFGEYKTNDINKFIGFSCYSSENLIHWHFEGLALPQQRDGMLGPNRIGERVKVMRCPKTEHYVMLMHTDDMKYMDPCIGLAISDSIAGEYVFSGALKYKGEPIRKWDMGTFIDDDGTAYLLTHEGDIYRLNDDYTQAIELVANNLAPGGESPAMFKKDNCYFLLLSNKTSWERNDNYYLTSKSIEGPWTDKGLFCPESSLTYNSQCSFVFNIGDVPIYMGDRWSFPKQASSATQVWLPIEAKGDACCIPDYMSAWSPVNFRAGALQIEHEASWKSNVKGETVEIEFSGTQIQVFGQSMKHGGYADFHVYDAKGELVHRATIDFYSLVLQRGIRYISPTFSPGEYTLKISVSGENAKWSKKDGTKFGSDDFWVTIDGYTVY